MTEQITRRSILKSAPIVAMPIIGVSSVALANVTSTGVSTELKRLIDNYQTALDAFHKAINAQETAQTDWKKKRPFHVFPIGGGVNLEPYNCDVHRSIEQNKIMAMQSQRYLSPELAKAVAKEADTMESNAYAAWEKAIEVENQRREDHGVEAAEHEYNTTCQAEFDARKAIAEYPALTGADCEAKAKHMRRIMNENEIQDFEIEGLIAAIEA